MTAVKRWPLGLRSLGRVLSRLWVQPACWKMVPAKEFCPMVSADAWVQCDLDNFLRFFERTFGPLNPGENSKALEQSFKRCCHLHGV